LTWCVTRNIWVASLKVKVTAWPFSKIVSGPKLCYLKSDFTTTFDKLLLFPIPIRGALLSSDRLLFINCRGHLSRCVTHLLFMPAYCLRYWYDNVQRCSFNVLLLFSLNINVNIEENTLYNFMHYNHNCTIGGVCKTFISFNCLTTTVLSMKKCQ